MGVKVYSTPDCPYCKMAKKFLTEKGIEFEDLNVADDEKAREEMIEKSGQMGVPVLDVNGTVIVGFDQPKLEDALGKGSDEPKAEEAEKAEPVEENAEPVEEKAEPVEEKAESTEEKSLEEPKPASEGSEPKEEDKAA